MPKPFALRALALVLGFTTLAATAARADLRDEAVINDALIDIAIAYQIGEDCPSLAARRAAGLNMLWSLRNQAISLGYSGSEIDDYRKNRTEQRRLEAIAWERAEAMGVVRGQPETFCRVGRAQIAEGTRIGSLLR